jgi:hypothetical protein
MAADMKAYIRTREVQPQLDPAGATYRRKMSKTRPGSKGTATALIDTGALLNSITWVVEED